MNNEQFRKLVLAEAAKESTSKSDTPKNDALGAKRVSFAPIPRASKPNSYNPKFAATRHAQQANIFKSITPHGVKLAAGYKDRTKKRHDDDELAEEIKKLEKALKYGEINEETFRKRIEEITEGDINRSHLVKGLDFGLLKKVKEGEDVLRAAQELKEATGGKQSQDEDIDDELDDVLARDVKVVEREKKEKKGQFSTVTTGQKRSRAQLLAEFKAQRAAQKAESSMGSRFKKIGAKREAGSRIEIDSRGREVLIIVDEDGHEKRKVKKAPVVEGTAAEKETEAQKNGKMEVLGMEVPKIYRKYEEEKEEESDVDIFDDVGSDYDPLAGLEENNSDSDSDNEAQKKKPEQNPATSTSNKNIFSQAPPAKINYFKNSKTTLASEQTLAGPSWSDPSIQAVFKKAATMKPIAADNDEDDRLAKAREEKRRRMLQADDRDAEDMDMGFGMSRFEDEEEDGEGGKVRLSKWNGGGGGRGEVKKERKRGGEERRRDGNSAAGVMRIIEQRKKEKS